MFKVQNYCIIAVEGLDVSGKETFVKSLKSKLEESDKLFPNNIKVISHAFPTYESDCGEMIKDILKTPIESRNQDQLNLLFALDRSYQMTRILDEVSDDYQTFHVILLDRYYFSNLLYGLAALLPDDISVNNIENFLKEESVTIPLKNVLNQYYIESRNLPIIDTTMMFKRVTEASERLHERLIMSKLNKDANETLSFQNKLSIVLDYLVENADKYIKPFTYLSICEIGSNFENAIYESKMIDRCVILANRHYRCLNMLKSYRD